MREVILKEDIHQLRMRTTKLERFVYGLFFFGQNLFYMLIFLYLSFFYTEVVLIDSKVVGLIFLSTRVWDAINDPLLGIAVDRFRLKSGKFIPWIKASTYLLPIIVVMMFSVQVSMAMPIKIFLAAISYLLFGMAYTLNDSPAFSLATVMSDSVHERGMLIAYGRIAAAIATLLIAVTVIPIVKNIGWLFLGTTISVFGFLTMLPLSFIAKERYVQTTTQFLSLQKMMHYIKSNRYLLVFLTAFLIASSLNFVESMGTYVAKYSFQNEDLISVLGAIGILPLLIVPFFISQLMKKLDKLTILLFSIVINIVFSILNYLGGSENFILFAVFAVFRSIGLGGFITLAYMFVADCIEYGAYKNNHRAEALTFSLQTFSTKLSAALSGAIPLFIFGLFGLNANIPAAEQTKAALHSVWFSFTVIPAIGMTFTIPLLVLGYKLRDKDIQLMVLLNQNKKISTSEKEYLIQKYGEQAK